MPGTTYEKDILVISMSKYIFLINHNIAYPWKSRVTVSSNAKGITSAKAYSQSRVPRYMDGLFSGRSRDQLAVQQVMVLGG